MPKLADRVKETSTTTGTGTYSLAGAATGYRAFSAAFATADTVYYCVEDGTDWEVGIGTLTTGTPWTLARTTILASSNAGAAVNWAAGTRNVFCTGAAAALVGKHTIGAPSGALFPATTNGCAALAQAETTTNKINYKYLAFDASAVEYAWFSFPSPKSYNASTVAFRAVWTHPATATNFKVAWQIQLLALADDDAIDTALGTAIQINDTGGTTEDFYTAPESAAVTPGNTAAKQDWMFARIGRVATDATNDTLAVDAHLIGVEVYYYTDAPTDV